MEVQGSPSEIQIPTQCNLMIFRSMTVPPTVLSPRSILPPRRLTAFSFPPKSKFGVRLKNITISVF